MVKEENVVGNPFGDGFEEQLSNDIWLPEVAGETLKGLVKDIIEGSYGKTYLIETDDGAIVRTPSHKVLQSRLADVEIGDEVGIIYKGQEPPSVKGQNPTRIYQVFVRR